jgi:hypothetical protein
MGFLDEAIRNLRTEVAGRPDSLELVSVFLHQDLLLFKQQEKDLQSRGLTNDAAAHAAAKDVLRGRPIITAFYIASWYWEARIIPTGCSNAAWSWIHSHNEYASAIRNTESAMDQIGSKGDKDELRRACNLYVESWAKAIDGWLKDR